MKTTSVVINGVEYIRADSVNSQASCDGLPYVIIRSRDSGCHAGYLKSESGTTVELVNARRIWKWSGATTLSQIAMEGVKKHDECKISQPVSMTVYSICEKIDATRKAEASIREVPEWK